MSNISNANIQVVEFLYDFAVHGGAVSTIDLSSRLNSALPVGSAIMRVSYFVETAMTSGGLATVSIGDSGSAVRYLAATAFNAGAFAVNNLAIAAIGLPHQVLTANAGKFAIAIAAAALTAGKLRFYVEYISKKN